MRERDAVRVVARVAPWLAPVPSAFFVARSAMVHLGLPWVVAAASAVIIETLGLSTVHTWLWLEEWNGRRRKTDAAAPAWVAGVLVGAYLAATVSLIVVLEVWPGAAMVAPALFPALAVVGAVNLAVMSRQTLREERAAAERAERKREAAERGGRSATRQVGTRKGVRDERPVGERSRMNARTVNELLDALEAEPAVGPSELARRLGRSRTTVWEYLRALEAEGRVVRDDGHVRVVR